MTWPEHAAKTLARWANEARVVPVQLAAGKTRAGRLAARADERAKLERLCRYISRPGEQGFAG